MEWGLLSLFSGSSKFEYSGNNSEIKSIAESFKILNKNKDTDPKQLSRLIHNLLEQIKTNQEALKREHPSFNAEELKVLENLNQTLTDQLKRINDIVNKNDSQVQPG